MQCKKGRLHTVKMFFPDSFIILLVVCWFIQRRLGIRLKDSGMTKEAAFSGVTSYLCLAFAVFAIFLRTLQ